MRNENPYTITPVVTPIVHMNGDRKHVLLEQLGEAYAAVQKALKVLTQAAPNGRNFYPVPGRMEEALAQHLKRCLYLSAVMDSLEAECVQIEADNPTRRA